MGLTKVVSLNVRGLNIPKKRAQVLNELTWLWTQVAYPQVTNLIRRKEKKLDNLKFPHVYHGYSQNSKSSGVAILIAHNVDWVFEHQWANPQGRFIYVKGKLTGKSSYKSITTFQI